MCVIYVQCDTFCFIYSSASMHVLVYICVYKPYAYKHWKQRGNVAAAQTPSLVRTGLLFYGKLLNARIEGEVTRRMQGMNPLLVIWGWMCHALEFYHRHSMGWIPPFSLRRAMTVLFFLAGPERGEEKRKGNPQKRAQRRRNGLTRSCW